MHQIFLKSRIIILNLKSILHFFDKVSSIFSILLLMKLSNAYKNVTDKIYVMYSLVR